MSENISQKKKTSMFDKFIGGIEKVGNKLPSPFMLFVYLIVIVMVLSFVLSKLGVSVTYLAAGKDGAEVSEKTVEVVNLLDKSELQYTLSNFVHIFASFPPLGLVLVMMMGIGFVEQTGFINAIMRKTLLGAPSILVTLMLSFIGVNANIASDAGMIFTASIGAALFKALGRNPFIGIIIGFAAGSGGFTANLFVAGTDALLSGITDSVSTGMGLDVAIHPLINYFFMASATFVLTLVVTLITEKYTIPRIDYNSNELGNAGLEQHKLTAVEEKGIRNAGIAFVIFIAVVLAGVIPKDGLLRAADGTILPKSPLISGIVPLLFFMFLSVGVTYGKTVGDIKSEKDLTRIMKTSLQGALTLLVVTLPSSLFIDMFSRSNLTTILAVNGSHLLEKINAGPIPLLLSFIIIVTITNLFMTSGSSKWLILAPIFIPMLSMLNLTPAAAQVAYRIGDSATNIISPVSSSLAVVIGLMEQYKRKEDKNIGIGTVIALTLPYAIGILVAMSIMLIVWVLLNLPLGPGATIFLS